MNDAEVVLYLSELFGAYVMGWGSGFLIHFFKTLTDRI
jgi:hypothetical protein